MTSSTNKKLGTYPGVLITVSLCLALFLIGFCGWVAISSQELIRYIRQNVEVQVYLDRNSSEANIAIVESELKKLSEIGEINGRKAIKFISKEEIATEFLEETNEEYSEILGENPFRDAFSLKLNEAILDGEGLNEFEKKVEAIPGVFEFDYAKDFIQGIMENANKTYLILAAVVLIFLVATLLLINNTIKLALYSQRFIIRTMQLIGAKNSFIQKPFLTKGATQGLVAGAVAALLLMLTQQIAKVQIEGLELIQNQTAFYILAACLLILGPIIGVLSTFQSIIRYLNIDLDDLY